MLVPLKWLNDYVDISGISVEELKNGLFSCGFEVEEIIEKNKNVNKIVVCKILQKTGHPNAEKLFVTQVDAGKYGVLQIVTNASDIAEGDYVPVAVDGAVLSDGTHIKKCKMRGIESFGMFCGGEEIGITEEYYDKAGGDSVLVFHDKFPLGAEVADILDIKDVIFDISVTANRPDCQSIVGIAREVSALLGKPFKMPDLTYKTQNANIADVLTVTVEDKELCRRYMAGYAYDIKIEKSPKWMQRRLYLMGVRAINNIVDITNYVLMEFGQPMHAFDLREIKGNKIIVRRAKKDEKIVTLDEKQFMLSNENLVICDEEKPSALAGIMGGIGSGVKDDTAAIILESASFKRDNIRKTSRNLNQRSASSARFEKGVDAYTAELGLKRALSLIDKLGAGKVAAGFIDVNSVNTEKKTINTSIAKINKLLGIDVPVSVIKSVLSGLQFEVETDGDSLTVKVPPYREDIEDYPDLAEEIIRMYGYEHIQNKLLDNASITFGGRTYDQIKEVQTKKYLASVGFSEIVTYSFISPNDYKNFGLNPENLELIKLKNPLGEDMSVMRTTLIPSIAAAVARNLNKKNLNGRMFELAKIYIPKALPLTELPDERTTLAMSVFGSGEDFFTMKGAVEGLFENLCYAGEIKYEKSSVSYLHPTRSADIIANSKRIGYFGELHPKISEKLGIDKEIYVCEIDYQSIKDNFTREYSVKTFSKFPQVERDLALVCDKELSNLEIVEAIKSANIKTLTDIKLFDVYTGDKIEKNKKSLAYRLTFSSMEKTLGDEEIENYIRKILSKLSQIGAVLR